MLATIQVNFRLTGLNYDAAAENKRTAFNTALHALQGSDAKRKESALKAMEELARKKFPPGMYAWGEILIAGELVPKDTDKGRALVAAAAEKHYGPALYDLGRMHLDGKELPPDPEKGLKMIRDAATLGSKQAQYFLGMAYSTGQGGVSRDPERARRYFRLCAAGGNSTCQVRLAKLLLEIPNRTERDYLQALAWLELAADSDVKEAAAILDVEMPKLSRDQIKWSEKMKAELVRK